jgi:hypothetical protein
MFVAGWFVVLNVLQEGHALPGVCRRRVAERHPLMVVHASSGNLGAAL